MKKKIRVVLIILFFSMLVCMNTGCWSARELSDMGVITAIGVDKKENGYHVTLQVMDPNEIATDSPTTSAPITTYSQNGDNIYEAIRKVKSESPRRLFRSHVRIIVLSEEIAKEGIKKILDMFARDPEMRSDYYFIIAKNNTSEEVLSLLTPLERISANAIFGAIENSYTLLGMTKQVTINDLLISFDSPMESPVLPGVHTYGQKEIGKMLDNVESVKPFERVRTYGLGVLKDDKLIGWLDDKESKLLNFIDNEITNTVESLHCPESDKLKFSYEIMKSDMKVSPEIENGSPLVTLELSLSGNILEHQCDLDLTNGASIEKIEQQINDITKNNIETFTKKVKEEFKSDIFGFGREYYRYKPNYWREKLEKNWEVEFQHLPINVTIESKVEGIGTIIESE